MSLAEEFKSFVKDYSKRYISMDRYQDIIQGIKELEERKRDMEIKNRKKEVRRRNS